MSEPSEEEVVKGLQEALGEVVEEVRVARKRRVFVRVNRDYYRVAVVALKQMGFDFIEAITGVDVGDSIEILAHFGRRVSVTVRTRVPKDDAKVQSIADLYPAALVYEREVWEMLGVDFEGHPDLRRFLLPEGWPSGSFPLRKNSGPGAGFG